MESTVSNLVIVISGGSRVCFACAGTYPVSLCSPIKVMYGWMLHYMFNNGHYWKVLLLGHDVQVEYLVQ